MAPEPTAAPALASASHVEDTDWVDLARRLSVKFKPVAAERERAWQLPTEELQEVRDTGLVNLLIPKELGGAGGTWRQVVRVIVELGKADPNLGSLLAYHYHNYQPPWLDWIGGAEVIQRRSAENRWLWGHVTHPEIRDFYAHPQEDGGYVLRGTKPMNTGPATGDVMNVMAQRLGREQYIWAVVPVDREGVRFHNDWDNLGLRRTNTSTITFDDVVVAADEVIPTPEPMRTISRWYIINGCLAFASSYLGATFGVLDIVKEQLSARTVRHPIKGSPATIEAPFALAEIGRLWTRAEAALAFLDEVAAEYDEAFAEDPSPDNEALDVLNARAEAFRVYAARLGIDASSKLYDLLGSRATANVNGYDRYWRDVRTHSLHGGAPLYGDRFIGGFFLNGENRVFDLFELFAQQDAAAGRGADAQGEAAR